MAPGRDGRRHLDHAFDSIERHLPERIVRAIRWFRRPESRWARLPLGVVFIVAGLFWFLPVLSIYMLPVGLLLIAHDVPALRRPVARMVFWIEERWLALRAWYQRRRRA